MEATGTTDRTAPALGAVVAAAGLWGLGGTVASRLFTDGADPIDVVAVRTWVSAVGLAGLLALRRLRRPPVPRQTLPRALAALPWGPLVGYGVAMSVANAGLFVAISRLPVAVALTLQNLAPVFVLAFGLVVTRRAPRPGVLVGLAVALLGVALVVELPTAPLSEIDLLGVCAGLVTASAVGVFSGFSGQATRAIGALAATTGAFLVASVVWLMVEVVRGFPTELAGPPYVVGVLAVAVAGTWVPFQLYAWGTARVGAQVGAVAISLEPLFGAGLAWGWLGESIHLVQWVGAAVLLPAVWYLQREPRVDRPARTAPPPDPVRSGES
jgi:drug/metabolite transporter (DMT)-like permease